MLEINLGEPLCFDPEGLKSPLRKVYSYPWKSPTLRGIGSRLYEYLEGSVWWWGLLTVADEESLLTGANKELGYGQT